MEDYELYKWFIVQTPVMQALYAGLFTWGLTALGAALVFLFNSSNRKALDMSLGFTGGVMMQLVFGRSYLLLLLMLKCKTKWEYPILLHG